ncbi:ribosome small subunit-dependent GTPase A [Symbiobacterium terraclitae]|uniref:Ribosome small subunit-dependent GTPase A n=1 Tax=Symbiobacterium terraclitae TaxID=557451 RepID=A0ABS4JVY3_9FIRM|nr:GTPase RsgA [Symbiobacterium terraclitae]MBP2019712.1 ribosome small subunit-dependent GTPase A [Symbiobacterium terraclitae]
MHQPTLTALEFPRIQQELAARTSCRLGAELALAAGPLPSLEAARAVQQETTEARALLDAGRAIPFGGIQDVRGPVERAAAGGVLTVEQLTAVADTIYGCRTLHRFLTQHAGSAPRLARYAEQFGQFDPIEEEIRRCIERGTVSDRASRALREIRGEIATLEGRIQDRLQSLLRQHRSHLQEALITTRNGRYVIPIKASARSQVPGTVHGASASGATLFVEPEAVARLSAELETWRAMEAAEVEQVLTRLSGLVAEQAERLAATLEAVAQLDLIVARGRLSQAWDARPVRWNEAGEVDLIDARHPLLGPRAIGNRIRLSPDRRMLIVTGPNTGGKTLLLKTLGLLVAIAQSGMHVPVGEGSTLCFFDQLFADIGDQQSLEQSLSTFSGHIANVAPMLAVADRRTLVLLDELGSGTDPHEGTALGIALLEAFQAKGAYVLVTTHLREIKEFGRTTPGCQIAGMGFDGESLKPTYRLVYGTLGESHGLEIAGRAGLPAAVVQRARELLYGRPGGGSESPAREVRPASAVLVTPGAPSEASTPMQPTTQLAPATARPPRAPSEASTPMQPATQLASMTATSWDVRRETAVSTPLGPDPTGTSLTRAPASILVASPAMTSAPPPDATASAAPSPGSGPLVLEAVSPRRCRTWDGEAEREVTVAESLRRELPDGLLPGDLPVLRGGQIVAVRPRRNAPAWRDADTQRETPLAANVTRLLILLSAHKPDFHASVLARHLLYAEYHGLDAAVCITKADMVQRGQLERWLAPFRNAGVETLAVDLTSDSGLDDLRRLLVGGQTESGVPAILANPGAGKSTLYQRLGAAEPRRAKGPSYEARAVRLPGTGWVIDLPSLRDLGMWKPDLHAGLRDFRPFAARCLSPGCLHRNEKGCAVRAATEDGELNARRYHLYLQLLKALGWG